MKKGIVVAAGLAAAGVGVYVYWRSILARLLKLPAPRCRVQVERNIPVRMSDGVLLYADHYCPRMQGEQPTILIRTPYGRGKEVALGAGLGLSELAGQMLAGQGYHVLVQGVRGCYDSEGQFDPHVNEAADGRDTVAWIAAQPWFDGRLATWGPSYLGYTQWAAADAVADAVPEAIQAMMIMITSSENFSVSHPDGAFGLESRLRWAQGIHLQKRLHGRPLGEQLSERFSAENEARLQAAFDHLPLGEADTVATGEPIPFYRQVLAYTAADDPYWAARDHQPAPGRVGAAIHFLGGWYDYYLRGLLRDYAAARAAAVQAGRQAPYLTIGPWAHNMAGGLMSGLREAIPWFDARLKGERHGLRHKPVRIYVMGADEWREMDDFPPPAYETRYYLQPRAGLAVEPPPASTAAAPDHYRYDPADPTPAVGGALLAFKGTGAQDNAALEARVDVLCYTTAPLAQALEIVGPVRLELYARSSLAHTDFFGRLCDVDGEGRSLNVCDGLLRVEPGRPEPAPDGIWRLTIDLWATAYRFRVGHRLRLQVSSGAHPRWSRNLGTGEPLLNGTAMRIAEQTIYHGGEHPSALVLPVL
jgi:putative CocE/NonD family hydrolase